MLVTDRLLATIKAAVPAVTDISIGTIGNSATVSVYPANQQAAAQATIIAFDWSQAAQDAWDNTQHPERTTLRQNAASALATNNTYIGLASPSTAQNTAQIKALTQQIIALAKFTVKLSD
jgi:N-acetylneuraminic acid mutarotase